MLRANGGIRASADWPQCQHAIDQRSSITPSTVAEAHKFFDEMDAVRRRHFDDATANALFGPDEGYARLTMVASLVEQDPKLTAEQKKEQIDALRAQLPPEKRSMIPDPSAPAADGAASQPGA